MSPAMVTFGGLRVGYEQPKANTGKDEATVNLLSSKNYAATGGTLLYSLK